MTSRYRCFDYPLPMGKTRGTKTALCQQVPELPIGMGSSTPGSAQPRHRMGRALRLTTWWNGGLAQGKQVTPQYISSSKNSMPFLQFLKMLVTVSASCLFIKLIKKQTQNRPEQFTSTTTKHPWKHTRRLPSWESSCIHRSGQWAAGMASGVGGSLSHLIPLPSVCF